MAKRPVFISIDKKPFFKEIVIEFTYNSGFAVKQKKRNIKEIHDAFLKIMPQAKILEISTKSDDELGVMLSAFNLKDRENRCMEALFQGSKVFENGGPYYDLYTKSGYEVKKNKPIKGKLKGFLYENIPFPLNPETFFYDWLYVNLIEINEKETKHKLLDYNAFTDIEFNPKKSINCQARSAAIYVGLSKSGFLREAIQSPNKFKDLVYSELDGQLEEMSLF